MALNWSIEKVKGYKRLYRKLVKGERGYSDTEVRKQLKQVPNQMIMLTMTIGMRDITDKNWEQFYNRIYTWERIVGVQFYHRKRNKMTPMYITKDDVKRMIGLHTNASTMTPAQFKKHLWYNAERVSGITV
tara:strand:- start:269 stop:661 length:393 start_codon:yes stop_codon:yes gene_type:complete